MPPAFADARALGKERAGADPAFQSALSAWEAWAERPVGATADSFAAAISDVASSAVGAVIGRSIEETGPDGSRTVREQSASEVRKGIAQAAAEGLAATGSDVYAAYTGAQDAYGSRELLDDIRARHRAGEISDADRALVEEWDAEISAKAGIAFLRATQLLSSPEVGGRRGGGRARDRGDEARRENGDERPGRIADPAFHANFEPLVTAYLNDVEAKSGRKIPPKQRLWVKEALKNEAHWRKRSASANTAARLEFEKEKGRLKKVWELMNDEIVADTSRKLQGT